MKTLNSLLKFDLELEVKKELVLCQDICNTITTFVKELKGYNDSYMSFDLKINPVKGAVLVETFALKVL